MYHKVSIDDFWQLGNHINRIIFGNLVTMANKRE